MVTLPKNEKSSDLTNYFWGGPLAFIRYLLFDVLLFFWYGGTGPLPILVCAIVRRGVLTLLTSFVDCRETHISDICMLSWWQSCIQWPISERREADVSVLPTGRHEA